MTAPATLPRDGEGWRRSPDLLSIDDKCDVVFGPMDAGERKALDDLTAGLAVGVAEFARRVRAVERRAGVR